MAGIGLKYPVVAKLENGAYTDGRVLGKAIKAEINVNYTDDKLYGDDGPTDGVKEFKDGSVKLNTTHVKQEDRGMILGHTLEDAGIVGEPTAKVMVASGDDDGPFMGTGFYARQRVDGKTSYRAIWLRKVQFAEPSESMETKGGNISFQTPTIEGTIYLMDDGKWKEELEAESETSVREWLNKKAGITA